MCLWKSLSPFRALGTASQAGGLFAAATSWPATTSAESHALLCSCLSGFSCSSTFSSLEWLWGILQPPGSHVGRGGHRTPCPDQACRDCCGQHGRAAAGSISAVCLSAWSGGHQLPPRSLFNSPRAWQIASLVLTAVCLIRGANRRLSPGAVLLSCCSSSSPRAWDGASSCGGLCRGGTCTPSLSQAPGHGFWQVEAVSWKLTRLVGPAEHLLVWAAEFLLTALACRHGLWPSGWLE